MSKPTVRKACMFIIILASFCFIYILNVMHPLFGDDWNYSISIDGHTRIKNFSDIYISLYDHYFVWGGRIIVHFIAETLLLMGENYGDIVNSLAYITFTLIIYFIANIVGKERPSLLLIINLLIFFLQPAFGSTVLWITGSANYMWGTLIIILFLYPYVKYVFNPISKNNIFQAILFFLGGIVAGWTNENMTIGLIVMVVGFILYYKNEYKMIPVWAITGLFGVIIGAYMMISAPGNFVRMEGILQSNNNQLSQIQIYIDRLYLVASSFYYYVIVPIFIFVMTLWIYIAYDNKAQKKKVIYTTSIMIAGAFFATLAMIGSPIFPGRAAFGIITLIIVSTSILYAHLDFKESLIRRMSYTTIIFALMLFFAEYFRGYKALEKLNMTYKFRLNEIEKGKISNKKDFVFDNRININNRFVHYYELPSDSTDWHNRTFSLYFGINSVTVK